LRSFERDSFTLVSPNNTCSYCLHPVTRELWLIEGGLGEVTALDLDTRTMRSLGGGAAYDQRHFDSAPYWNPITRRMGSFGGYGKLTTNNERWEFDEDRGTWVQIDADRDAGPWRRIAGMHMLIPGAEGREYFLVGGFGSPSGKQHQEHKELRYFRGAFHQLDDIWELDLQTKNWRCLVPVGSFDPYRLQVAVWMPMLHGLVIAESASLDRPRNDGPRGWLLHANNNWKPQPLRLTGEVSNLNSAWGWALDPASGELLILASDGIYRVRGEIA